MSNTLVMIAIFVGVGVFFYFSAKYAKKPEDSQNPEQNNNSEKEQ